GKKSYTELSKVIPSFIRRGETNHKYQRTFNQFVDKCNVNLKFLAKEHTQSLSIVSKPSIKLIHHDPDSPVRLAAALLFAHTNKSLEDLQNYCQNLPSDQLENILDAACEMRENRRHKSPRALEHVFFTFEICADFGAYRDLQRHRMLTQERQPLSCNSGYFIPEEILGTSMEKNYRDAQEKAKDAYDKIVKEFPEEAQYVVPMAYNINWYFHVNLRALQWLCELRSQPAGHPTYRYIAQEMAAQVIQVYPEFKRFFAFVDFEGYDLGRLGQEIRKEKKTNVQVF
ncbi:MAG: FAD-dependent thymidylate synthase, partial [Chlamydiales bacterium]|nr:FAD-dependent thymidylate synthase [Chlamydiales bacterium]